MKLHEEVLVQLKAEIEAMEGEEGEVQARLMDLRHELERYSAKMKENQQKIKHFQNEVGEWRGEKGRGWGGGGGGGGGRRGRGRRGEGGEREGRRKGREEGGEKWRGVGREWKGRVHVERSYEHVWGRRDGGIVKVY